jgi:hypothetical protein
MRVNERPGENEDDLTDDEDNNLSSHPLNAEGYGEEQKIFLRNNEYQPRRVLGRINNRSIINDHEDDIMVDELDMRLHIREGSIGRSLNMMRPA